MRTIHLRNTENGEWLVGVTANRHVYLSVRPFQTRGQAVRAFLSEGRHQPCARMLIHVSRGNKVETIREGCEPEAAGDAYNVEFAAVKAVLHIPRRVARPQHHRAVDGADHLQSAGNPG